MTVFSIICFILAIVCVFIAFILFWHFMGNKPKMSLCILIASEQYEKIPIKVVYICSDGTEIEFSSGICVVHRKDGSADSYTNATMKREGKE